MRLKHSIIVQIGDDAEMKDLLFSTDATLAQVQIDGFQRANIAKVNVAAAGTESLPLGDVDVVKGFYLKVDQEAVVRLNGSSDDIQLRKGASASHAKLFMEIDLSAIEVDAPATSVTTGIFVVWGDPSA